MKHYLTTSKWTEYYPFCVRGRRVPLCLFVRLTCVPSPIYLDLITCLVWLEKAVLFEKGLCVPCLVVNVNLRQSESEMRHIFLAGSSVASWVSSLPESTVARRASSLLLKYRTSLLCLWLKLVHREWSGRGMWGSKPLLRRCQLQMRNFILLESLFR